MHTQLKPWQLVLLMLLFPAVGTFFVCSRDDIDSRLKIAAGAYCFILLLVILMLRRPAGQLIIDAVPIH